LRREIGHGLDAVELLPADRGVEIHQPRDVQVGVPQVVFEFDDLVRVRSKRSSRVFCRVMANSSRKVARICGPKSRAATIRIMECAPREHKGLSRKNEGFPKETSQQEKMRAPLTPV
jgi:hypothetical protein